MFCVSSIKGKYNMTKGFKVFFPQEIINSIKKYKIILYIYTLL
jgi:hypothetical protein